MRFQRLFAPASDEAGRGAKVVTSQIKDADGRVLHEVAGVAVPESWSATAVDMLAQKYLRRQGVPRSTVPVPEEGVPQWLWRRVPTPGENPLGRETSAQQAFHRMAGVWTYHAWKRGYFSGTPTEGPLGEESARIFYDEVVAMLAGQIAAPNSPQWFNTGLHWAYGIAGEPQGHYVFDPAGKVTPAEDAYSRPAASACFIQAVEDKLLGQGGILDLVEREARVFKFGGGSGTNFSKLRGKGEPLSGGGSSSGLLSWLKINDRSAAGIKSGGTTRRAARMVIVDVDHPDIEEFVRWKPEEEYKVAAQVAGSATLRRHLEQVAQCQAKALDPAANGPSEAWVRELAQVCQDAAAAGVPTVTMERVQALVRQGQTPRQVLDNLPAYTTAWEDEAYSTVSGQNANNTVRVPDGFVRAALSGESWDLTWRTDGRVARTVRAGDLWDQIVDAAWSCADPGLHFATTVNDWNTCPADGEIVASNPCFTGDTRILTARGYMRIDELVCRGTSGEFIPVLCRDGSPSVPSQLLVTGINPILRVSLSDGRVLRTTPDHNWLVGSQKKPASELKVGDVVDVASAQSFRWDGEWTLPSAVARGKGERSLPRLPNVWSPQLAEVVGHLVGDGCVTANSCVGWIYGVEESERGELANRHADYLEELFGQRPGDIMVGNGCRHLRLSRKAIGRFFNGLGVLSCDSDMKVVPESVFTAPKAIVAAFLRGYFGADGTCAGRADAGECEVAASSTSLALLRGVQMLLDLFGLQSSISGDRRGGQTAFGSYLRKECYRLRINPLDLQRFAEEIGFSVRAKQDRLDRQLPRHVKAERWAVCVAGVEADGCELTFNLTEPMEHRVWANGVYIPQCGEYIYLDNTACNLASLNLLKFVVWVDGRPRLDTKALRHAARIWQVILDVTIDMAGYPSPEIARGSWAYRTTGLGYCNLGALLMVLGLPYDSDEARAVAAAIACIVHCQAYDTSAELAAWLEPFPRFGDNRAACLRVVRNHAAAALGTPYEGLSTEPPRLQWPDTLAEHHYLCQAAREAAQDMLASTEDHGLRNAQVTVVAPTGTIGLLMDADTTGIEPDFALVKYKKLAGGGWLKLVNQTVKQALAVKGYTPAQIDHLCLHVAGCGNLGLCLIAGRPARAVLRERGVPAIDIERLAEAAPACVDVRHVLPQLEDLLSPGELEDLNVQLAGTGHLERAPHLRPEHLPIFDCASRLGSGKRFLRPEAHIFMLASVQPFVSGSISKTVNAPADWTREQVASLFLLGWSLACKDIAVYRDRCKLSQVLYAVGAGGKDQTAAPSEPETPPHTVDQALALIAEGVQAKRRTLPDRRLGYTQKARIGKHKVYLRTGEYSDGTLGEIFLDMHKEGTPFRSLMNHFAIAISIGLQHGVPLEEFVDAFVFTRFDPSGPVKGNAQVKYCTSLTDYLFRELAVTYLGRHDLGHAGPPPEMEALEPVPHSEAPQPSARIANAPQRSANALGFGDAPQGNGVSNGGSSGGSRREGQQVQVHEARCKGYEGECCSECGMFTLVRTGKCSRCDTCGTSTGCS